MIVGLTSAAEIDARMALAESIGVLGVLPTTRSA
jgi:hypothetical protein